MPKRKILYSPGFGAGWSSWEGNSECAAFMLTYKPIVDFIENGGMFTEDEARVEWRGPKNPDMSKLHPILRTFAEECLAKFGTIPCMLGAPDLQVKEVHGKVRINDYDGSESVEVQGEYDGWL